MSTQLISASNPRYSNAESTAVILECEFSHLPGEVNPFNATPNDVMAYGRDIYARAIAGEFGPIAPYFEPNISLDVAPPPVAPKVVTMRQARLALLQRNLLASVEAAVAQAGTAAQIEWEYAQELRRTHPLTVSLSAALGLTEQQLDDLFMLASTL